MNFRIKQLSILVLVAAALPVRGAFAHGTGAIKLSTKQSAAGATVTVLGSEFNKNSSVRLELRGVLATQVFGRVATGPNGTFQQVVTIPVGTKPGQYSIVAVAPDGDVVADATLMIADATAASSATPASGPMMNIPGMQGMMAAHATAEKMKVPIPITTMGWSVIATIIVVSAAAGISLLRSGGRSQSV